MYRIEEQLGAADVDHGLTVDQCICSTFQDTAGQLRRSPYEFAGIGATSPLLWLTRRFAILDGPTMPIIAGAGVRVHC